MSRLTIKKPRKSEKLDTKKAVEFKRCHCGARLDPVFAIDKASQKVINAHWQCQKCGDNIYLLNHEIGLWIALILVERHAEVIEKICEAAGGKND